MTICLCGGFSDGAIVKMYNDEKQDLPNGNLYS